MSWEKNHLNIIYVDDLVQSGTHAYTKTMLGKKIIYGGMAVQDYDIQATSTYSNVSVFLHLKAAHIGIDMV